MTPTDLRACISFLHPHAGQTRLAGALGVSPRTVRAWLKGAPMPRHRAEAVTLLCAQKIYHEILRLGGHYGIRGPWVLPEAIPGSWGLETGVTLTHNLMTLLNTPKVS